MRLGLWGRGVRRVDWWEGGLREERLVEEVAVVMDGSGGCCGGDEEEEERKEVVNGGFQHYTVVSVLKNTFTQRHSLSLTVIDY